VAGAKLVLVMGHTHCGAVMTAVQLAGSTASAAESTGCQHIGQILRQIQSAIDPGDLRSFERRSEAEREAFVNEVACANIRRTVSSIIEQSETLAALVRDGRIAIVGAIYDVKTSEFTILTEDFQGPIDPRTATIASGVNDPAA
jgi:carbonic anhydrase